MTIIGTTSGSPQLQFFTRVEKVPDGYLGTVTTERGAVYCHATEIRSSRRSIECVLSIDVPEEQRVSPPYIQRVDIRSQSATKNLVTSLNSAYGGKKDKDGYNWDRILNAFISMMSTKIIEDQQPTDLLDIPEGETEFLLHPFLQKDAPNMIFARSEAGKSMFALRMAISLAIGSEFLGFPAIGGKKTLYIDYEDTAKTLSFRLRALCLGMNVDYPAVAAYIQHYKPMGPLPDNLELLKRMTVQGNYSLIIIDSGGIAIGGSPSDDEKVNNLYNTLEQIPATKLILHHEPKYVLDQDEAYFGSQYWRSGTRVAWRLKPESSEGDKYLIKAVLSKKSNMGYTEPFFYEMDTNAYALDNFEKGITTRVFLLTRKDYNPTDNLDNQVIDVLRAHQPCTATQIAELVESDRSVISRLLHGKLKDRIKSQKQGKSIVYSLYD